MKKFAFRFISIFIITLIVSCGKGPGATFLEMQSKICETKSLNPMIDYTAPESQGTVSFMITLTSDPTKSAKIMEDMKGKCENKNKILKEEIDGETAVVYLENNNEPIKMRKVDGKWKIVFDKK